ncbi:MAG: hypothetical protein JXA54_06045 [Candidatus Heimdallarchaeota archaeon]|nr:hypothetical protein [Candidatus Heimdallarchaeota archaeon]
MTYVPPEKKQKGGTSGFGDIVYVFLFYVIEGIFIFIGIPALVIAIAIIPMAMYSIITQGKFGTDWVLIVVAVLIVFIQILAIQYFVRKYILKPNNMRLGQWLRWKFSPTEIQKRRAEKAERSRKMDEWYASMERIQEREELIKNEQAYDIRDEWFKEKGDPDFIKELEDDDTIVIGEIPEDSGLSDVNEQETIELGIIGLNEDREEDN